MKEKIEQVISFLQGKAAGVTVAEINSICQILGSTLKEEEQKNVKKDTNNGK